MSDCMPKEQYEHIKAMQDYLLDVTNMTEEDAWNFAFRCWQLCDSSKFIHLLNVMHNPKSENTVTPREIAVKTGKTVVVLSNGLAHFVGRYSADESKMLRTAKITDEDWDNVYYPDGTSEWERMKARRKSQLIDRAYGETLRIDLDDDMVEG